jgi:GntR family transcriptional repressor for pyruvate dehydrogenase complex
MTRSATASAPIVRLDRSRVADRIADELRMQIARGELPHGAKLPAERALAERYGVSAATVREAIRALTTIGLLQTRHGSGSTVSADEDALIAMSLGTAIQLREAGIPETLGILGALNSYAATLAVTNASTQELDEVDQALDQLDRATTVAELAGGLKLFLDRLAAASHNPLLRVLTRFLADLQIGIALEIWGHSFDGFRAVVGKFASERRQVAAALRQRDREAARAAVERYHRRAMRVIGTMPGARKTDLSHVLQSKIVPEILSRRRS